MFKLGIETKTSFLDKWIVEDTIYYSY